ncbi:hypothetical protein [Bacillus weihaiensis]|nr:hypothetical protein [Bacillus weihaiensis]
MGLRNLERGFNPAVKEENPIHHMKSITYSKAPSRRKVTIE